MTQVNVSQKSFSAGEISPELESRSDVEVYDRALSDSLNVLCTNKGDLIPRPGTEFVDTIATTKDDAELLRTDKEVRIIPWKYSDDESYLVEFTERKLRIYRDGKRPTTNVSALDVSFMQYPRTSASLTETGEFVFIGKNSFPYEAGDGPFTIEDFADSEWPINVSYRHPDLSNPLAGTTDYPLGAGESDQVIINRSGDPLPMFWVHSVDRDRQGVSNKHYAKGVNDVIGKSIDVVRITWHPSYCEGGSNYDPTKFLFAEHGNTLNTDNTLSITNQMPPTSKWVFRTKGLDPTAPTDRPILESDQVTSGTTLLYDLDYWGPTDLATGGAGTSTIQYLSEELRDLQYAQSNDLMFVTHPNHQPLKITRVGPQNFRIHYHRTEGGPWRDYPTYPGMYWGGHYFMKGGNYASSNTFPAYDPLGSGTGVITADGPTTAVDIRNRSDATQIVYLYKSEGTPQIVTNSDLSNPGADVSIAGRKIRVCLEVGPHVHGGRPQDPGTGFDDLTIPDEDDYLELNGYDPATGTSADGVADPLESAFVSTNERNLNQNEGFNRTIRRTPTTIGAVATRETNLKPAYFWFEAEIEPIITQASPAATGVHANPTGAFRIRITRPPAFLRSTVHTTHIIPSARTKIGRLFEPDMPDGTGGWPSSVAIYNNRLIYAGNKENPKTLAFSVAGNFDNFEPDDWGHNFTNTITQNDPSNWSVAGTVNPNVFDYHGFTYTLQEGLADKINWVKSTNYGLLIGTDNGLYLSPRLGLGDAVTPFNFDTRLVSEEGTCEIPPLFVDGKIYYVNKRKDKLLSMEYVNDVDGFRPKVESILAEHMLESGIKEIAYARTPISVIWIVTEDGMLISAVRLDTDQNKAFFKHKIASSDYNIAKGAFVKSIAVIPSDDKSFDQLYLGVKRLWAFHGVLAEGEAWSPFFGEPDDASEFEENGSICTIERLTQYEPYLSDSRDFCGLDAHISDRSHYVNGYQYRSSNFYDHFLIQKIVNANVDDFGANYGPFWAQFKSFPNATTTEHQNEKFIIRGVEGPLSYLNYAELKTADTTVNANSGLVDASTKICNLFDTHTPDPLVAHPDSTYGQSDLVGDGRILFNILNGHKSMYMPGRIRIANFDYAFSEKFFPYYNNFSIFLNGIEDHSVYSLGEYWGKNTWFNGPALIDVIRDFPEAIFGKRSFFTRGRDTNGWAYEDVLELVINNAFSSTSSQYNFYGFCYGWKPEVYFTTLPPKMNNQLGNQDLSYTYITSVSANVENAHQFEVSNYVVDATKEELIDDEYSTTEEVPINVERRSGTYKASLLVPEEDSKGKVKFEPHVGYPFRLTEITLRGERATRG